MVKYLNIWSEFAIFGQYLVDIDPYSGQQNLSCKEDGSYISAPLRIQRQENEAERDL